MGTPSEDKAGEDIAEKDDSGGKFENKPIEEGEIHEGDSAKEDEDVPDDFFDDFSNQDFMAGLDIVDAWDETEKNKKLNQQKRKSEKDKSDKQKQRKRSRERKSRSTDREKEKRRRSAERRQRGKDWRNRKDSPSKKRTVNESELRRDPSKTKRDLEKDRENYAKKKEQKLISKVVETGLVPPGMESEVNLSELENKEMLKEGKGKVESKTENHKVDDSKRSRERGSRDRSRERRRRRSPSYNRNDSLFRGRSRGRSGDLSRGRSGDRSRGRSGDRRRDRSRDRSRDRRDRSRDHVRRTRSPERITGRMRAFSPLPQKRRRSRSLSDRERWLLHRRSPSPERKYRGRMGESKISFLEELKMKLDGHPTMHSPGGYPFPPNSGPPPEFMTPASNAFHPPTPVGPPPQFFPSQDSPYDQNFFIGEPQPVPPSNLNGMPPSGGPSIQTLLAPVPAPEQGGGILGAVPASEHRGGLLGPAPASLMQLGDGLLPMPNYGQPLVKPVPPPQPLQRQVVSNTGMESVAKIMEQIRANSTPKPKKTENAAKLLGEKKLSLTDFLSINSRPTAFSSSPEALHKKVQVLSRCQDILKELSGDKKIGGKLVVTNTNKNQLEGHLKNASPLIRKFPVEFAYSTPWRGGQKPSFQTALNKILVKTGVITEVIELNDDELEKVPEAVIPPPVFTPRKNVPFAVGIKTEQPQIARRVLMKMCQTDPIECEDCEQRKAVKYASIGIQCGETERYNVGVQVVEADIISSKIPKNQSMAYLTPAQLLGRSEPTSTRVDNFGSMYNRPMGMPLYRDFSEFSHRDRHLGEQRRMDYQNPLEPGMDMRDPRMLRY